MRSLDGRFTTHYFTLAGRLGCFDMSLPAIHLQNLTLGYGRHKIIQHVDIEISNGALLAVVGANGAGKSTLLKALMGELKPLQGSINFNGFFQS